MTGRVRLAGRIAASAVLLALLLAPGALGHATPAETDPRHGEALPASPEVITVRMTQRIDPGASELRLLDAQQEPIGTGELQVSDNDLRLTIDLLEELPAGGYVVKWKVLSTVDGHTTQGTWAFAVGEGAIPEVDNNVVSSSFRWDAILGKAILYAGFALAVGALAFAWWPLRARFVALPHFHALVATGGSLMAVGMVLFSSSQVASSGLGWGAYFGTTFGRSILARDGLAALLLIVGVAGWRMAWTERRITATAVPLLLAFVGVHAFFGHPAEFLPTAAGAAVDAVHLLIVAAWVGGLVPLLLYFRTMAVVEGPERLQETARRFSGMATIAIVVATLTGIIMSAILVGRELADWTDTPYGRALVIKIALVLPVLAILGAINRWVYVRSMRPGTVAGFRRNVGREISVAFVVFLVAGAVTNLTPTAGESTAVAFDPPPPTLFREMDAEHRLYHIYIDPGPQIGKESRYELHVLDPETFEYTGGGHSMRMGLEHEAVGKTAVWAEPMNETGKFEVNGAFFSAAGPWNITMEYRHPDFGQESVHTIVEPEE